MQNLFETPTAGFDSPRSLASMDQSVTYNEGEEAEEERQPRCIRRKKNEVFKKYTKTRPSIIDQHVSAIQAGSFSIYDFILKAGHHARSLLLQHDTLGYPIIYYLTCDSFESTAKLLLCLKQAKEETHLMLYYILKAIIQQTKCIDLTQLKKFIIDIKALPHFKGMQSAFAAHYNSKPLLLIHSRFNLKKKEDSYKIKQLLKFTQVEPELLQKVRLSLYYQFKPYKIPKNKDKCLLKHLNYNIFHELALKNEEALFVSQFHDQHFSQDLTGCSPLNYFFQNSTSDSILQYLHSYEQQVIQQLEQRKDQTSNKRLLVSLCANKHPLSDTIFQFLSQLSYFEEMKNLIYLGALPFIHYLKNQQKYPSPSTIALLSPNCIASLDFVRLLSLLLCHIASKSIKPQKVNIPQQLIAGLEGFNQVALTARKLKWKYRLSLKPFLTDIAVPLCELPYTISGYDRTFINLELDKQTKVSDYLSELDAHGSQWHLTQAERSFIDEILESNDLQGEEENLWLEWKLIQLGQLLKENMLGPGDAQLVKNAILEVVNLSPDILGRRLVAQSKIFIILFLSHIEEVPLKYSWENEQVLQVYQTAFSLRLHHSPLFLKLVKSLEASVRNSDCTTEIPLWEMIQIIKHFNTSYSFELKAIEHKYKNILKLDCQEFRAKFISDQKKAILSLISHFNQIYHSPRGLGLLQDTKEWVTSLFGKDSPHVRRLERVDYKALLRQYIRCRDIARLEKLLIFLSQNGIQLQNIGIQPYPQDQSLENYVFAAQTHWSLGLNTQQFHHLIDNNRLDTLEQEKTVCLLVINKQLDKLLLVQGWIYEQQLVLYFAKQAASVYIVEQGFQIQNYIVSDQKAPQVIEGLYLQYGYTLLHFHVNPWSSFVTAKKDFYPNKSTLFGPYASTQCDVLELFTFLTQFLQPETEKQDEYLAILKFFIQPKAIVMDFRSNLLGSPYSLFQVLASLVMSKSLKRNHQAFLECIKHNIKQFQENSYINDYANQIADGNSFFLKYFHIMKEAGKINFEQLAQLFAVESSLKAKRWKRFLERQQRNASKCINPKYDQLLMKRINQHTCLVQEVNQQIIDAMYWRSVDKAIKTLLGNEENRISLAQQYHLLQYFVRYSSDCETLKLIKFLGAENITIDMLHLEGQPVLWEIIQKQMYRTYRELSVLLDPLVVENSATMQFFHQDDFEEDFPRSLTFKEFALKNGFYAIRLGIEEIENFYKFSTYSPQLEAQQYNPQHQEILFILNSKLPKKINRPVCQYPPTTETTDPASDFTNLNFLYFFNDTLDVACKIDRDQVEALLQKQESEQLTPIKQFYDQNLHLLKLILFARFGFKTQSLFQTKCHVQTYIKAFNYLRTAKLSTAIKYQDIEFLNQLVDSKESFELVLQQIGFDSESFQNTFSYFTDLIIKLKLVEYQKDRLISSMCTDNFSLRLEVFLNEHQDVKKIKQAVYWKYKPNELEIYQFQIFSNSLVEEELVRRGDVQEVFNNFYQTKIRVLWLELRKTLPSHSKKIHMGSLIPNGNESTLLKHVKQYFDSITESYIDYSHKLKKYSLTMTKDLDCLFDVDASLDVVKLYSYLDEYGCEELLISQINAIPPVQMVYATKLQKAYCPQSLLLSLLDKFQSTFQQILSRSLFENRWSLDFKSVLRAFPQLFEQHTDSKLLDVLAAFFNWKTLHTIVDYILLALHTNQFVAESQTITFQFDNRPGAEFDSFHPASLLDQQFTFGFPNYNHIHNKLIITLPVGSPSGNLISEYEFFGSICDIDRYCNSIDTANLLERFRVEEQLEDQLKQLASQHRIVSTFKIESSDFRLHFEAKPMRERIQLVNQLQSFIKSNTKPVFKKLLGDFRSCYLQPHQDFLDQLASMPSVITLPSWLKGCENVFGLELEGSFYSSSHQDISKQQALVIYQEKQQVVGYFGKLSYNKRTRKTAYLVVQTNKKKHQLQIQYGEIKKIILFYPEWPKELKVKKAIKQVYIIDDSLNLKHDLFNTLAPMQPEGHSVFDLMKIYPNQLTVEITCDNNAEPKSPDSIYLLHSSNQFSFKTCFSQENLKLIEKIKIQLLKIKSRQSLATSKEADLILFKEVQYRILDLTIFKDPTFLVVFSQFSASIMASIDSICCRHLNKLDSSCQYFIGMSIKQKVEQLFKELVLVVEIASDDQGKQSFITLVDNRLTVRLLRFRNDYHYEVSLPVLLQPFKADSLAEFVMRIFMPFLTKIMGNIDYSFEDLKHEAFVAYENRRVVFNEQIQDFSIEELIMAISSPLKVKNLYVGNTIVKNEFVARFDFYENIDQTQLELIVLQDAHQGQMEPTQFESNCAYFRIKLEQPGKSLLILQYEQCIINVETVYVAEGEFSKFLGQTSLTVPIGEQFHLLFCGLDSSKPLFEQLQEGTCKVNDQVVTLPEFCKQFNMRYVSKRDAFVTLHYKTPTKVELKSKNIVRINYTSNPKGDYQIEFPGQIDVSKTIYIQFTTRGVNKVRVQSNLNVDLDEFASTLNPLLNYFGYAEKQNDDRVEKQEKADNFSEMFDQHLQTYGKGFYSVAGQERCDLIQLCDCSGKAFFEYSPKTAFFSNIFESKTVIEPQIIKNGYELQLKWTPTESGLYQLMVNGIRVPSTFLVACDTPSAKHSELNGAFPPEIKLSQSYNLEFSLKDKFGNLVDKRMKQLTQMPIKISAHLSSTQEIFKIKEVDCSFFHTYRLEIEPQQVQIKKDEEKDVKRAVIVNIFLENELFCECQSIFNTENYVDYRLSQFRTKLKGAVNRRGSTNLSLNRFQLLKDLLKIAKKNENAFTDGFRIQFKDEEAHDQGGPQREFFSLIGELMRAPEVRFVSRQPDGRYFFHSDFLQNENYEFIAYLFGQLVGNAIYFDQRLGIELSPLIWKVIYQKEIGFDDLLYFMEEDVVGNYRSLRTLSKEELDGLNLNFTHNEDLPLMTNGKFLSVTKENLEIFLLKLAHFLILDRFQTVYKEFSRGLTRLVPLDLLQQYLYFSEVSQLFQGKEQLDRKYLLSICKYENMNEALTGFWVRYIEEADESTLKNGIKFITGCQYLDMQDKQFCLKIELHTSLSTSKLPTSSTCANKLRIPNYSTYELLKRQLDIAFNYGAEGFGMR